MQLFTKLIFKCCLVPGNWCSAEPGWCPWCSWGFRFQWCCQKLSCCTWAILKGQWTSVECIPCSQVNNTQLLVWSLWEATFIYVCHDVCMRTGALSKTAEDSDSDVGKTKRLITQDKKCTWISEIELTCIPSCSWMRLQLLHFHAVCKTWPTFQELMSIILFRRRRWSQG